MLLWKCKWKLKLYTSGKGDSKGKFVSLFLQRVHEEKETFYYRFGWEDKNGKEVWKKQNLVMSDDQESEFIGDATFLKLEDVDNIIKADGSVTLIATIRFRRSDKLNRDFGLLLDGKHTDVEIQVTKGAGGVIKAHRAILAARSPMFNGMFDSDTIENQTGVITIDAYDFDVIRKVLEYLYTSQIEFNSVEFATVLRIAADYYQIPDLVDDCEIYILYNLDNTSVVAALLSTAQLESALIKEACLAEIKEAKDVDEIDKFQEIIANPELSKLVFNHLLK